MHYFVPVYVDAGNDTILEAATDETVILPLPQGLTVSDLTYVTVWCRKFSVLFGKVLIKNEDKLLGEFVDTKYEVSGTVYARDTNTLVIKDFNYDGLGPDAFFYVGTKGNTPIESGIMVPYPQGNYYYTLLVALMYM